MSLSRSALPSPYFAIFGIYEPLLTAMGFIGALMDPIKTHNMQAPWPAHIAPPQPCTCLRPSGLINFFLLRAARRYLSAHPALQEKVVSALLTPLLIGDILHLALTFWALGDMRWNLSEWSYMLWLTVILGLSLLIPRVAWHLGIGRYTESRDGKGKRKELGANVPLSGRL
ncbi:hypothetical protein BGY98DRAFT_1105628 [Russula aff. rugulosa BPL654]|nr:hypothetical protein BGY98DRAFT_1105628 [Russula aff. rugulosa BPL654]